MKIKKTLKKNLPDNVMKMLKVIDNKIRATRAIKNKKAIHFLLYSGEQIKLEFGAGNRKMKGWTTIDMNYSCDIFLDLRSPIPFPDNSVDQIYSSHLLEHFDYSDLVKFLAECYRILKKSGSFKVAVPNAKIFLDAYLNQEELDVDYYFRYKPAFNNNSKIDYVNYIAYMDGEHRYMFDEENLSIILANAGFSNVRLREFDPSLDIEQRDQFSIYAGGIK